MKLFIDLLMRTGSFETDTARASRTAQRRAKEIERAFNDAGNRVKRAFAGMLGGVGIASLMRTFAQETTKAQNEQAQLAAVIESTGQAAGYSVEQLNKMADEMARVSTFDAGDINRAQTRLLSYTGIVGEQFPQAMQAVIDMAARMGMSVEQSAETIGRALDIPSQGLTALTQQGFRFTEQQKLAVKQLEATGRVGEAQRIILDALESSYGGAAKAARDTFGGAVEALQSELRSLMTGKDGGLDATRDAVESLTKTLQSPETKQAFETFTSGLATVTAESIKAAVGLWNAMNASADLVESMFRERARPAQDLLTDYAKSRLPELSAPSAPGKTAPLSEAEIARLAAEQRAREARAKAAKDAARQADAYIENLKRQMQATLDLTVVERTLEEIRSGSLKGAGSARRQQALDLAAALDAQATATERARQAEEEMQELIRRQESIYAEGQRVIESMRTPSEQLGVQIERLNFLLGKGAIDWETYSRAVFAAQDGFDAAQAAADKTATSLDDFAKNAAENIQSNLGDTLYNALSGNFDGISDSFSQMLNRMLAEALAADIARALFGADSKGNVMGTGGLLGKAVGWLGMQFGGARASGGPVSEGTSYLVGERGPELFVPNTSGKILPNRALGGAAPSVSVENHYTFAPGANIGQLRSEAERIKSETTAEIINGLRRGRWALS